MNPLKLLSNLPIEELTAETDYLGILNKGDLIKQFLTGHKESADTIKMFALYGDWGSGKSTVMKYLKKTLAETNDFNTFFFEAWEYERDENLALSLLEFLKNETKDFDEEYYGGFYKKAKRVIKGIAKSVSIEMGIPKVGSINIEPEKFVEEFEKTEQDSFYTALNELKKEFKTFEEHLSKGKEEYNIVFIDDLDRCEPKHVLDLLSSIKLFFTYGKKTIFFCGVDKKAIEQAVKTQYSDIVKSEEYMEKIFDISFSMPLKPNIDQLINQYFNDTRYIDGAGGSLPINKIIKEFFESIEFTNPRKLKKVLNKFQILRSFRLKSHYPRFPEIDMKTEQADTLFDTLLVLYLIVLHEFYPELFSTFLDFKHKKQVYSKLISNETFGNANSYFTSNFQLTPFQEIPNSQEKSSYASNVKFNICISPINLSKFSFGSLESEDGHLTMIIDPTKPNIDYLFYSYISSKKIKEWMKTSGTFTTFSDTKRLINNLL